MIQKLFNIDRRIIFAFMFLSVLLPFLVKFDLPIEADKNVRTVYNKIEAISKKTSGGIILMSFDYDNSTKAELEPAARAILSHAFSRNVKVIGMSNWPNGVTMAKTIMEDIAKEYDKKNGVDWAYLGYKSGAGLLMLNLSMDFHGAFPTDTRGEKIDQIPLTKNVRTIKDIDYVMSLSAGSGGIEEWIIYSQSKYNYAFAGVCTAVSAPDYFPFLQSGQMHGLIGGLAGAAQYETMINKPGTAIDGMRPQSVAHLVLIFFIVFGNICYFVNKNFDKKKERA